MFSRRALLAASIAVLSFRPALAGGPPAPFDQNAFEAAQKAGKPILVEITAPWCPVCAAQKPIIEKLRADPRFKELEIFNIDFDTQKDLMRRFGAHMQSTLIGFKGAQETGRSVGETQAEWIEQLLEKTL